MDKIMVKPDKDGKYVITLYGKSYEIVLVDEKTLEKENKNIKIGK